MYSYLNMYCQKHEFAYENVCKYCSDKKTGLRRQIELQSSKDYIEELNNKKKEILYKISRLFNEIDQLEKGLQQIEFNLETGFQFSDEPLKPQLAKIIKLHDDTKVINLHDNDDDDYKYNF